MMDALKDLLNGHSMIAMEYSPLCSIPYVSRVDAGTVEAIERSWQEGRLLSIFSSILSARWH